MLKKIFFSGLLFLFLAINNLFAQITEDYNYRGTIGDIPITMQFTSYYYEDTRISGYHGSYRYDKVGVDIELSGVWVARQAFFEIAEFGTAQKTVSGYFELKYTDGVSLLTGTWYSFDGKRKLPVKLRLVEAEED